MTLTSGPRLTKPAAVEPTTVRLPVTATASAGIVTAPIVRPATWKDCGTPWLKIWAPAGLFTRESSTRTGVTSVYVVFTESRVMVSLETADQVPRLSCHWT